MSNKIKVLTPKQRLVLQRLAEGMSLTDASVLSEYDIAHVCRLRSSPQAREYLDSLLMQSERLLAEYLPVLVGEAINELRSAIRSESRQTRLQAVRLVLTLARPLVEQMAVPIIDTGSIINQNKDVTNESGIIK